MMKVTLQLSPYAPGLALGGNSSQEESELVLHGTEDKMTPERKQHHASCCALISTHCSLYPSKVL